MLTQIGDLSVIQAPIFLETSWLWHGFGFQNVSIESYVEASRFGGIKIPKIKQAHTDVISLDGAEMTADAMITDKPNLLLHVRTADCLPILLVDPEHRAIGVVHAGWRGTAGRLIEKTLLKMQETYGTNFEKVKGALGPAIGGREYVVKMEVMQEFKKAGLFPAPWFQEQDREHWHLDIAFANRHLLQVLGVASTNLYLSLACTKSDLRLASFRRDGARRGEQVNFVMIRA